MNKTSFGTDIFSSDIDINDKGLDGIFQSSLAKKVFKGEKLFSQGKKSDFFYFLRKGSAKSYYFKDSQQICLWFAFDNDFVATISLYDGKVSNETVEMLEDSEVIRFRIDELKSLSKKNLTVSNFSLNMIKEHAVFLEYKLNNLQFMTSEERYSSLISDFPDILQKVSLTDISSYLGIARETLSRIRGRQ